MTSRTELKTREGWLSEYVILIRYEADLIEEGHAPQNNKMGGSEIITGHLSRVTGIAGFFAFCVGHLLSIRVFENLPSSLIIALTSKSVDTTKSRCESPSVTQRKK